MDRVHGGTLGDLKGLCASGSINYLMFMLYSIVFLRLLSWALLIENGIVSKLIRILKYKAY